MNVVIRCLARAEACIGNLRLESRRTGVRRNEGIRRFLNVSDRVAVYEPRRGGRGIGAELRRAARIDGGTVLRSVDARLIPRTQREITRRDGEAAVLVGDVVVIGISRAEDGICNLRLESCRSCIRRDGCTRVNRLRDRRNRIAVHEVRSRLDAEQIRPVHIARRRVRRAVDAALIARDKRQRTLCDIEMSVNVGDVIIRRHARREMRRACLCPKTCRARICRDGCCRIDRLRHIVDGVAVHQPRGRGSRSDVDLRRVVDIVRRRIGIAVEAALVARRDGERTLFNRQRPRGRGDVVVRRKASAAGCKSSTVKCHRVCANTCALRNRIAAVHCRNRVLRKTVT